MVGDPLLKGRIALICSRHIHVWVGKTGKGKEEEEILTSRHDPYTALGDGELIDLHTRRPNFDHNLAFVDEKGHLHLAAVLGFLVSVRRNLNNTGAEERQGNDLGVFELRACDIAGLNG